MQMLQSFLEDKPLFYDEIDLERMPKIYQGIKDHLSIPKIIHIVGTNGKGTTGRFLANALLQNSLNVGHYTSPHILKFNERIWLNGHDVDDLRFEEAHCKLMGLLTPQDADALSYFEYTTLLAMVIYEPCDYVVLEAGLGGEFDATNVFAKVLSLFTKIDKDHESFLGSELEEIAGTKMRSMQSSAILGLQKHASIKTTFKRIASEKNVTAFEIDNILTQEKQDEINTIAAQYHLPKYLQENLLLAISALVFLGYSADIEVLAKAPLFGRLSKIRANVYLDVGHNALAAEAIASTLQGEKFTLIYNSYRDKDYEQILEILRPIITDIELIDVDDVRVEQEALLTAVINAKKIPLTKYDTIVEDKNYLVFGSFSVAEAFLRSLS